MERDRHYIASATGVDVALPIAGTGSRSYAFLVDWHIRVLLACAWLAVVLGLSAASLADLRPGRPGSGTLWLAVLPAAALYLLYHPVLEMLSGGRTPGKRMAGVRIVTRNGGTPSVGALLVRNIFRLVDSLPMLYLVGLTTSLLTREHVRLGDLAAGTLLVHDAPPAADSLATIGRLAGASRHDPKLLDVAASVLARWGELEPARRAALARRVLEQLGDADAAAGLADADLRARLQRAVQGDAA